MDAVTNGLSLLFLDELIEFKKNTTDKKISGIFERVGDILPTPFEISQKLYLIPTTYVMSQISFSRESKINETLAKTIEDLKGKYNYIILDAQAGAADISEIIFENSDDVIIVSEFDPISSEGIDRLKRLFPNALTYDKTWILFNKILPEFTKILGQFTTITRYLSPIPWDKEVVLSYAKKELPINLEKGNDYTFAFVKTAQSLLGKEIEEEINAWKVEKQEEIKRPIFNQLEILEKEIKENQKKTISLELSLKNIVRGYIFRIFSIVMMILFATSIIIFRIIGTDDPLRLIFGLALGVVVSLIFGTLYDKVFDKKRKQYEVELRSNIQSLKSKLGYLKERRKKFQVIVDSDLENLFKNT